MRHCTAQKTDPARHGTLPRTILVILTNANSVSMSNDSVFLRIRLRKQEALPRSRPAKGAQHSTRLKYRTEPIKTSASPVYKTIETTLPVKTCDRRIPICVCDAMPFRKGAHPHLARAACRKPLCSSSDPEAPSLAVYGVIFNVDETVCIVP
jgi:hypothetical protein